MDEIWKRIPDFPEYLVSNHGRVINHETDHIKTPTPNQLGIPNVCFSQKRIQSRRGLALLVANAFLEPHIRPTFTTPINLDGDRFNCHVDNLAWRPRWFALEYHAQYKKDTPFNFTGGVEIDETGESFVNVRDCAKKYGLLERNIIIGAMNNDQVFPQWYTFRVIGW